MGAFDDMLERRPGRASVDNRPVTARVVKVGTAESDGWRRAWVVPIDGDTRVPIGPCRAGRLAAVDDVVLLVWTLDDEPWLVTDRPREAGQSVQRSVFTTQGDLAVGTGPSSYATLSPGGPGQVLTGDPDGLIHWATRRDTGDEVLAAAGTVAGHDGMVVTARRIDNVVAVELHETSDPIATGTITVATLPVGYRLIGPAGGVAGLAQAYSTATQTQTGTVVILTDGTVRLHATGGRNSATITGATADAWPT